MKMETLDENEGDASRENLVFEMGKKERIGELKDPQNADRIKTE
jgi:hypothetical protein